MPPMSMRISASSSTMRISAAMGARQLLFALVRLHRILCARVPERHAHHRAAAGSIVKLEQGSVILDDVLHDRQPKARAARARRYIRLRQPLPPLVGQAAAIVLDAQDDVIIAFA